MVFQKHITTDKTLYTFPVYTFTKGVKRCKNYTVTLLIRIGEKHHARPNQPADSGLCYLGPCRTSQCPRHREQPRPMDGIHAGGDPPATRRFVVRSTDKRGDQQITNRPTGLRQLASDDRGTRHCQRAWLELQRLEGLAEGLVCCPGAAMAARSVDHIV